MQEMCVRLLLTSENSQQDYEEYYAMEEELNRQLNVFAVNYSLVYGGNNTVAEQLGFPSQEGEVLITYFDHRIKQT